ncbi:MarR family transcriptional regulator [soil metagenome]
MELEKEIKQEKFRSEKHKASLNIMFTNNWLQAQTAAVMKKFNLTPQQYNVLRILKGQHPQPAMLGQVQERMLDRMSNASRLVDKLLLKGLVERRQCPNNRRQVDIWITEKGLELLQTMEDPLLRMESHLENVTEEEAQELSRILDKLRG